MAALMEFSKKISKNTNFPTEKKIVEIKKNCVKYISTKEGINMEDFY